MAYTDLTGEYYDADHDPVLIYSSNSRSSAPLQTYVPAPASSKTNLLPSSHVPPFRTSSNQAALVKPSKANSQEGNKAGGIIEINSDDDDDDDVLMISNTAKQGIQPQLIRADDKGVSDLIGRVIQSKETSKMIQGQSDAGKSLDGNDCVMVSQVQKSLPASNVQSVDSNRYIPALKEAARVTSGLVCFGMISTTLTNVNQSFLSTQKSEWIHSKVVPIKRKNQAHYALILQDQSKSMTIAEIGDHFCYMIGPILSLMRYEIRVFNQYSNPKARILCYGDASKSHQIGKHFKAKGYLFEMPDVTPKQSYQNPQQDVIHQQPFTNQREQSYAYHPMTPAAPLATFTNHLNTEAQAKSQILALYKSFTSPEDLAEMKQDDRLTSSLFKYQRQALWWMSRHEQDTDDQIIFWNHCDDGWTNVFTDKKIKVTPDRIRGGILADDMGLGKTIQIISLILKNQPTRFSKAGYNEALEMAPEDRFGFVPSDEKQKEELNRNIGKIPSKSTLIICPLSTVHNWEDQINSHSKSGALSVLLYHGPGRTNNASEIARYDVVISTYNIIAMGFLKTGLTTLHKVHWHRIVLDEAHIIKTNTTGQAKAAFAFSADIRWCLTGTPVQNKLDDLYSLIRFIRVKPLDKKADWNNYIIKPISQAKTSVAFANLQLLMKGITLRRTKNDLVDGKPILTLPDRFEEVRLLELNEKERVLYDKVHKSGKLFFESLKATNEVMKNYVMILKAILMMRQACLHSSLVKYKEEDLQSTGMKLTIEEASNLFRLLKQSEDDRCASCYYTMDLMFIAPCKHLVCNECLGTNAYITCFTCNQIVVKSDLTEVADLGDDPLDLDLESGERTTKIDALIADLIKVRVEDSATGRETTKFIIFSQFTAMLSLCQSPLKENGFCFVRLDGTMSLIQRAGAMESFKHSENVTVFLISIKSGGVGLNLVSANRVYLMEPYWNPAVEQQAIDRVHRLGQKKNVTTIRFIIKNSIEENMQARQKYKTALAEKAMDEDGLEDESTMGSKKRKKRDVDDQALEKLESLSMLFR